MRLSEQTPVVSYVNAGVPILECYALLDMPSNESNTPYLLPCSVRNFARNRTRTGVTTTWIKFSALYLMHQNVQRLLTGQKLEDVILDEYDGLKRVNLSHEAFASAVFASFEGHQLSTLHSCSLVQAWKRYDPEFEYAEEMAWWEAQKLKRQCATCKDPEYRFRLGMWSHALESRWFFLAEDGSFGMCPEGTESGDSVVVLLGGAVPFILRLMPPPDGTTLAEFLVKGDEYKLIGECYVDGLMDGELFSSRHFPNSMYTTVEQLGLSVFRMR
jgi:hypothetical protein